MVQAKQPQDAIYEVTVPLPNLPVKRLDTSELVDHGYVRSDTTSNIKSTLGWVKGAKADRADAAGGSVPAVSVQFCLFASHPAAVAVASAVEMGSANYPASFEGKVSKDAVLIRGLVLEVDGAAPGGQQDIVTVRRL